MKDNLIIIRTDGGAGSQVAFCALGKFFEDKGYKVKYDMTWFEEYGPNHPGGDYIMNKAFPNLCTEFATKEEVELYQKRYSRKNEPLEECKPPMWIGGYPEERPFLSVKYREFFAQNFVFGTDDTKQKSILDDILQNNACGVHIRRVGLVEFSPCYGYPADKEYFLKVIDIVSKTNDNVKFYFFSDEMDWVKEHIIPYIKDKKYEIVEENDDRSGYLDMYLLSRCKIIISSNGGFALTARLLSCHKDVQLWMCKNWDFICEAPDLDNIYIYIRPKTIVDRKQVFKQDFEIPAEFKTQVPIYSEQDRKKYKKYKRLFNVFLLISIIYTAIFVVLLTQGVLK